LEEARLTFAELNTPLPRQQKATDFARG